MFVILKEMRKNEAKKRKEKKKKDKNKKNKISKLEILTVKQIEKKKLKNEIKCTLFLLFSEFIAFRYCGIYHMHFEERKIFICPVRPKKFYFSSNHSYFSNQFNRLVVSGEGRWVGRCFISIQENINKPNYLGHQHPNIA